MASLRPFRPKPNGHKGIRARSALVRSAELVVAPFPAPITREQARAALARSRARRAAGGARA
jgi:hypothetical protein